MFPLQGYGFENRVGQGIARSLVVIVEWVRFREPIQCVAALERLIW